MKKFLLIPLLCMVAMVLHAQSNVSVEKMGKSELVTALSGLGKMVFTQTTLQVYSTSNELLLETNIEEGLAMIIKESAEAIENVNGSVVVRQDPAHEMIHIEGASKGTMRIITLKGEVLMSQPISGEASVSTAGLNAGMYLLQINNTTLKLIKQ